MIKEMERREQCVEQNIKLNEAYKQVTTISIMIKFIYSEKVTKFCEISTLLLSVCTVDKSKVEISQILWPSQNILTLMGCLFSNGVTKQKLQPLQGNIIKMISSNKEDTLITDRVYRLRSSRVEVVHSRDVSKLNMEL